MKESNDMRHFIRKDQAETLRLRTTRMKSHSLTRVISFTSGKGGVGKTNTVVNTAISLAEMGRSVLILDADLGLANVDVLLGLRSENTLYDVIEGRCSLSEILIPGPAGITIIPAASGVESICDLDHEQRLSLMHAVEDIAAKFDYLLIDTRAGISADVMQFNSAANEIICVITSEPTSLTDAYAMIKVLAKSYSEKSISILANNIQSQSRTVEDEAMFAFKRIQNSVDRFLKHEQVNLKYLGYIPSDPMVSESVKSQRGLMELYPSSSAGLALKKFARKLDEEFTEQRVKGGMQFFFKQLMEVTAYGS
jgi:flagellar biosynthesis protein FlhG